MNSNTCLTNLTVVIYPTCIYCSTGSTYLAMEEMSQLEELVETFLASYTITAGYYDGRTLQVVLGSLYVVIEYLHYEVLSRNILAYLWIDNFLLALTLVDALLHHAGTYGSHLWTVLWIDDGSHDVTTESWTNLIEQTLIVLAALLVVVITDFKLCTVGSQTAGEGRRNTRTEVATDNGSTHQRNLRILLLEEVDEDVGMWS